MAGVIESFVQQQQQQAAGSVPCLADLTRVRQALGSHATSALCRHLKHLKELSP